MLKSLDQDMLAMTRKLCATHPRHGAPFHGFQVSAGEVAAGILAHMMLHSPERIGIDRAKPAMTEEFLKGAANLVDFLADNDPISHSRLTGNTWHDVDHPGLKGRHPYVKATFAAPRGVRRYGTEIGDFIDSWFHISAERPGILNGLPRAMKKSKKKQVEERIYTILNSITPVSKAYVIQARWAGGGWHAGAVLEELGEVEVYIKDLPHIPMQEVDKNLAKLAHEAKLRTENKDRLKEMGDIAEAQVRSRYGDLAKVTGRTLMACYPQKSQDDPREGPGNIWCAKYAFSLEALGDDLTPSTEHQGASVFNGSPEPPELDNLPFSGEVVRMDDIDDKISSLRKRYRQSEEGIEIDETLQAVLERLGEDKANILSQLREIGSMKFMDLKDRKLLKNIGVVDIEIRDGIITGRIKYAKNLEWNGDKLTLKNIDAPLAYLDSLVGRTADMLADDESLKYSKIVGHRKTDKGTLIIDLQSDKAIISLPSDTSTSRI